MIMTAAGSTSVTSVGSEVFREAMTKFPSGVTIVTTVDGVGVARGFTATAFCSVSEDPPLVLVCLAKSARCHAAFEEADAWMIHVVSPSKQGLALRFASRIEDKFGDGGFRRDSTGLPTLENVPVRLACTAYSRYSAGDHTVLIGRVYDVALGQEEPVIYLHREFRTLASGASRGRERPVGAEYADAMRTRMFE